MSDIQALVNSLAFDQDSRGNTVLSATLERPVKKVLGLEIPGRPLHLQMTLDQVLKGDFSQIAFPSQEVEDYFARTAGEMVLRHKGLSCG